MSRRFSHRSLARGLWLPAAVALAAACGGASTTNAAGAGQAAPPGVIGSVLPPIPDVVGPVELYVEYPDSLQRITASDSNFIFGSVGTGDATLLINGQFVEVNPNGSFLGWLPVPPPIAEGSDSASYFLEARRETEAGVQVDTLRHWFLRPATPFEGEEGRPWIDPGSAEDRPERWAMPDEVLEIVVRAASPADVWLDAGSSQFHMTETSTRGMYRLAVPASALRDAACADGRCEAPGADPGLPLELRPDSLTLGLRATLGGETATAEFVLPLVLLDPLRLPVAELDEPPGPAGGPDGIVNARPSAFGPYRWLFANGTRAVVDGRLGRRWRLRLAPGLEAWASDADVRLLPPGTRAPTSEIGDLRFEVREDRITLRTWLAAAVPVSVEELDSHTIELTFYGVRGGTNRIAEGAGGRLVERIAWSQLPGERYQLRLHLAERVWGYQPSWARTGAGGAELTFDIRRPPPIDPTDVLAGRRIAIDPGHPGAGAHGPTGYYEGDANLAIGRVLARLVLEAGGEPILVRDDTLPMGLYERTVAAIDARADVLISIHNNALPDGVQPVGREGTSTYYYHPHSHELATAVQQGMLETMRLRDLGVYWGDLAIPRMSWMPSILTEGAFMMIPQHEAALKTTEFQELYALGVLRGIEAFFADVAREAAP